jgi:recombination associated protein RdgC
VAGGGPTLTSPAGPAAQLENTDQDGLHAELDARYALMAGELKRLFAVLEPVLKFSAAEA